MRTSTLCSTLFLLAFAPAAAPGAPATSQIESAPNVTLRTRDGATMSLETFRGKVVLLDFWASWCEPCRHSFPWLDAMRVDHASDSLVVLAVNLDKTKEKAEKFLAQHPAGFGIAFDPEGKSAEAFHVGTLPSTYLIGRDGAILCSKAGFDPRKTGEIEAVIEKACAR